MRPFQAFDMMNVADEKSGTATLGLCNSFVEARTVKQGGLITMGVPPELVHAALNGTKTFVLLAIDYTEYKKYLEQPDPAEVLVKALETALYYHVLSPDLDALFRTALSQHEQLKQQ